MPTSTPMLPQEKRVSWVLASVMSFRLFGLFLILPVLPWYQHAYTDATPALMGWVMGAYGLAQGLLQIPMGMLSDKIGRRPVILAGLLLFILGSIVAAEAHHIYTLILGRTLQGAGAVGATILACLADLTRTQVRTKAMAIVGISIGLSFSFAFLLGPLLEPQIGLKGLFWITGLLGIFSWISYQQWVPKTEHLTTSRKISPHLFKAVLKNPALWRFNLSVFCLHALFSASFLFIPTQLIATTSFPKESLWQLYLSALVLAILSMGLWVRLSAQTTFQKSLLIGAVFAFLLSIISLGSATTQWLSITALFMFFSAFNALEASLPSWVSRIAPATLKGTAMGLYSTAQFFGIFIGGVVGSRLYFNHPISGMIWGCVIMGAIWLLSLIELDLSKHAD